MRSFILILATIGIIAAGFLAYWLLQPSSPSVQVSRAIVPATRPADTQATERPTIIGAGEGAWVKQFDLRTGHLRNQFRGAQYKPTGDGTVIVTRPEAEFFLSDGQYLRLRGERGVVVMELPDASGQQEQMRSIGNQPPSRGELENVTVELFRNLQARRATLTLELPNAEFDNEMFRISTRAYEQDGQTIAADQVPVKVRGADYDFDGRGLVIRWNERSQRLEMLEIAHGGRLVIKHPDEFGGGSLHAATMPRAMFADVSGAAIAEELADEGDLYRVTFFDQVRIEQSGQPMASAEELRVSFRLKESPSDDRSSLPATRPLDDEKPTTRPKRATTRPSVDPITILWTGPLQLAPRDERPERRIRAGDALVQLVSQRSPVVVSQQGQRIECATLFYESGDATFHAESSESQRVRLSGDDGAIIQTQLMSFSIDRGIATLSGVSRAELPVETDGRTQTLLAEWTESCRLTMDDARQIRAADLRGSVVVRHPQVDLASGQLDLKFDKPTGNGSFNVRRIEAAWQVDCRMKNPSQDPANERRIRCEQLVLSTETDNSGRMYPRQVDAAGAVHATEASREIRAGQLTLKLSPGDQNGEIELASFSAEQDVQISTSDGGSAQADQIIADQSQIKLIGQPARVADASTMLTGPIIQIQTDDQISSVLGKGSLRLAQSGDVAQPTTRPIDITWGSSAVLDGKTNQIEVAGDVSISTANADAGDVTATGERMKIVLIDLPSDRAVAGSVSDSSAWNFDFLRDKEVSSIELLDNVKVASILSSSQGELLRRMTLYAPSILYTLGDGNLRIPAAGRMLYEDYAPRQTALDNRQRSPAGATAFAWSEQMLYNDAARQATMNGDVAIVHQPLSGDDRFRLDAKQVVAELDTDAPNSNVAGRTSFNIRRLIARGDLLFTGRNMELTAQTIEYDPNTHWLTGRGTEHAPAEVTQRLNAFSAEELWINTETGDVRFTGAAGTIR